MKTTKLISVIIVLYCICNNLKEKKMLNAVKSRFSLGAKLKFLFLIVHCTLVIDNCLSQWQPDVRLTNDPAVSRTSDNNAWCIASSGQVVHVVWHDSRDGNEEIYYKRSTDGGSSWGADTRLTNDSANSFSPSVSVSGSAVHVVWYDLRDGFNQEIYYKRSTDGGSSWGADTRLTNNTASSLSPSVSVSGQVVHVVWRDTRDGNNEIYYKRSTDGGISFGADTRLTNDPNGSDFPSVSVSGQVVHVVWHDIRDGNTEIYYKRSTDGGSSWGADTRLTNNSASSTLPSVSVSGQVVHVLWQDNRDGNLEIYYKRSTDGGISFGADTRLTNNSSSSSSPSVSVSGQVVHVLWQDFRDGNPEIYYKRSTDGGISWGADTRLTNNSAASQLPSVSVSGSVVHVVWQDQRDGNPEIYYKRDQTGNPSSTFQSQFNRNNLNKPITDNGNTLDTISVSFTSLLTYYVLDVNLKIDTVIHTSDSDLEFYLIHNGITDTVIYQAGGSGDNFIGTVLNDSATTLISNGTAPFTGSYKPHKPLSQFNNGDINGDWILKIFDRATGNTGTLNAWSLIITILNNTTGIEPIGHEIPNGYTLSQNYPNPFNPSTKIRFDIPQKSVGQTFLSVYDILGREVATLVNEELKPGTYEVEWDGSNQPSGVYFYKLTAGSFVDSKKMILIK